jgi:hypothetical protein
MTGPGNFVSREPVGRAGSDVGSRRSRRGYSVGVLPLATVAAIFASLAILHARQLQAPTIAAYDRYVALTETRLAAERAGTRPFLWLDQQSAAERERVMARLRKGEVVVEKLETRDKGAEIAVPNGLVHHWVGTVLMPGVKLDRLVSFVQDYDRYPQVFAPMIPQARVLDRDGDRFIVRMRTSVKKVITVVMDGDYTIEYHRLGANRLYTTNVVNSLEQINDAGTSAESKEKGDEASGYLWRFRMYCAFEERPDASIEQCESISLTRSIPFGVGWLIKPFVTGIPRDTIAFTLGQVRAGLVK